MPKKTINTEKLPVISISGRKGYGKDFWSDYIVKTYKNAKKIAFATPLREEVDTILRLLYEGKTNKEIAEEVKASEKEINDFVTILEQRPERWPELNSYSRTHVTLKLLQYWGNNVRRNRYGKNYWIDKVMNFIKEENKKGFTYVISDARYPNEVDAVHEANGLTITIYISDEEQARRLKSRDGFVPDITQLSHVSETGLYGYSNFHLILLTELYSDEMTQELIEEKIDRWE